MTKRPAGACPAMKSTAAKVTDVGSCADRLAMKATRKRIHSLAYHHAQKAALREGKTQKKANARGRRAAAKRMAAFDRDGV